MNKIFYEISRRALLSLLFLLVCWTGADVSFLWKCHEPLPAQNYPSQNFSQVLLISRPLTSIFIYEHHFSSVLHKTPFYFRIQFALVQSQTKRFTGSQLNRRCEHLRAPVSKVAFVICKLYSVPVGLNPLSKFKVKINSSPCKSIGNFFIKFEK